MKKYKWATWPVLSAAAILSVLLYNVYQTQDSESSIDASSTTENAGTQKAGCGFWSKCDLRAGTSVAVVSPTGASVKVGSMSREVIAGQEPAEKIAFQLDAKGHIVLDEEARLNIEKLSLVSG